MYLQLTEAEASRFWSYVAITEACWLWTGTPSQPYGLFGLRGNLIGTHVVSYAAWVGPIADGLFVCHRCNVKRCVRPDHLYLATPKENVRDAMRDGLCASGERHWTKQRPGRMARGLRNGAYTHPERRPRGDRNGSRLHPESIPRGAEHKRAKLTEAQVLDIRKRYVAGGLRQRDLALEFGVHQTLISHIVNGKSWRHLTP